MNNVSAETSELRRSLQPRHIVLIALGGVIGAGLFVGSGASIHQVGPAIVASYLIAGAIVFAVMQMIADLAMIFTGIHAFTDLVRAAIGNGPGFVVAWLYWYLWIVVMAIEAMAGGVILHQWLPFPVGAISATLILIMMTINLTPARSFGEVEFWFSSIKVAAIVAFILYAAAACFSTAAARSASWLHLTGLPGGPVPHGWLSIATGVVSVFFSLTGAELTTIAAVEANECARNKAGSAAALIGRIVLFYVGSVLLVLCAVPWTSIVPGISPFVTALDVHGIHWAGTGMALIILTAVLSCMNAAFYVSSRVLFGLAARGDAPKWLVRLRHGVPHHSVFLGAGIGAACLLIATLAPEGAFSFLVNASGSLIVFIYLFICVAHFQRASGGQVEKAAVPRSVVVGVIAALISLLAVMCNDHTLAAQFYTSLVPLSIATGIAVTRRAWRARK